MALALPFDPSLGVADPNHAAALPGICPDADAALARTNHAAAGSRKPIAPFAVLVPYTPGIVGLVEV